MKTIDAVLVGIVGVGLLVGAMFGEQGGQTDWANPATFDPSIPLNGDQLEILAAQLSSESGSKGVEEEAEEPGLKQVELCDNAATLKNAGIYGTLKARNFKKTIAN